MYQKCVACSYEQHRMAFLYRNYNQVTSLWETVSNRVSVLIKWRCWAQTSLRPLPYITGTEANIKLGIFSLSEKHNNGLFFFSWKFWKCFKLINPGQLGHRLETHKCEVLTIIKWSRGITLVENQQNPITLTNWKASSWCLEKGF